MVIGLGRWWSAINDHNDQRLMTNDHDDQRLMTNNQRPTTNDHAHELQSHSAAR